MNTTTALLAAAAVLLTMATTAEAFPESADAAIQSARNACMGEQRAISDCMADRRANAALLLDQAAMMAPRLAGRCEGLHPDPIAAFWCVVSGMQRQAGALSGDQ